MIETGTISAEDVSVCYRLVLGREPESAAIVGRYLAGGGTRSDLINGLLNSVEFRMRLADEEVFAAVAPLLKPSLGASRVEPDVLQAMVERVRSQWTSLGEADPYWSVLSSKEFRATELNPARIVELRASGWREAQLLTEAEERTGHSVNNGVCVELGCGVGRITRYLAERFEKVVALDISPGNLAICAAYMAEEGITNVETRLITSFADFAQIPEYDTLFSVIVLQHNPPPVQRFILNALFSRLKPGGAALFQVATHLTNYRFDATQYLNGEHSEIEMHALPLVDVLEEIGASGMAVIEAVPDPFTGQLGSYTFFAERL